MPVDEKTRQALDLKKLRLPSGLAVTSVDVEDYTDWTGDPSLRVNVLLDESVDVEKVGGQAIGDFTRSIRDSLKRHGITVFPYIFFAKPSELQDADED